MRILIASGTDWPFPARLAQAFARLGARVEALCLKASPLRHSDGPARVHSFSGLKPLTTLKAAIDAAAPDLFLPCDDLMAELMARLAREEPRFAPLAQRACGDAAVLPQLVTRNAFLQAAAETGAPAADTLALEDESDLDRAIARFGLPLVIKADGSWGGEGVVIARSRDAADTALQRFRSRSRWKTIAQAFKRRQAHLLALAMMRRDPGPGAQRFIAGKPATSAIACWQGRVVAANHFDVMVAAGGGTGPATVLTRVADAAMQASAEKIAARFGLSGIHGLDYMRDADGNVFLLELNPRATPTSHLALGMGHDLPAALLSAAGIPTPDRPAVTQGSRIILYPQEVWRDPESPYPASGYHDVPADDPRLVAALTGEPDILTSFSSAFPGLSDLEKAPDPLRR
jgi:formate-dependent phosphoribosylglycinamide formyltransferase (GAR transformylase)